MRTLIAALAFTGISTVLAAQAPPGRPAMESPEHCAKACSECALRCDMCAAHCAMMVAEGKKDHMATLQTCQDCASICTSAACVTAKRGPFSGLICTACAEACKHCGDACEKHRAHDEQMRLCAEECRRCEAACREMIKNLAGAK